MVCFFCRSLVFLVFFVFFLMSSSPDRVAIEGEEISSSRTDSLPGGLELVGGLDMVRSLRSTIGIYVLGCRVFQDPFSLPEGYSSRCPSNDDRVHEPGPNEFGVYMLSFKYSLKLLISPLAQI